MRQICSDIGIECVRVTPSASSDTAVLVARMPPRRCEVEIDTDLPPRHEAAIDTLLDRVHEAQRILFADCAKHMRVHSRDPHNRLCQLEDAAKRLIAGLDNLDLIGMPATVRGPLEELRAVVNAAPRELGWKTR